MAENKKSFILYADLLATVSKLNDTKAGKLFKTILEYVNDKNPEPEDMLVQIAFEPVKQQLKRDLKDWEEKRAKRSEAGRVGGLKSGEVRKQNEANVPNRSRGEANEAVTVNGTVTVNVTDTVTERENTPPADFWTKEAERKRPIAECYGIAMNDQGWISKNKTSNQELLAFNDYLEKTGDTLKTILDYKKHFYNLKQKRPDALKQELTTEQLRQIAKELSKQPA